jgi:glycosyltransferase involved in cell wall biosynthesis
MDSKQKKRSTLVIAIYSHIEAYPPSLNALFQLSDRFDTIYVLVRNIQQSNWSYPKNVELIPVGESISFKDATKQPISKKIAAYVDFGMEIRKVIKRTTPSLVLLYDTIAFSLFNIFAAGLGEKKRGLQVWYHNHDVVIEHEVGVFSIIGWLRKLEILFFSRIDFFSLPNFTRIPYFPVEKLKRKPFVIPNYPSKHFFGKYRGSSQIEDTIRLVFQGHINPENLMECFLEVLPKRILNYSVELHLIGPISEEYKARLLTIAGRLNVEEKVHFYGRLPYSALPPLTSHCHIGIAAYGNQNVMVRTMSTASNKLFEYCSAGLPVIVTRRNDLVEEFSKYEWIHFSDFEGVEIEQTLIKIVGNYKTYAARAIADFENILNYEIAFKPVLEAIDETIKN